MTAATLNKALLPCVAPSQGHEVSSMLLQVRQAFSTALPAVALAVHVAVPVHCPAPEDRHQLLVRQVLQVRKHPTDVCIPEMLTRAARLHVAVEDLVDRVAPIPLWDLRDQVLLDGQVQQALAVEAEEHVHWQVPWFLHQAHDSLQAHKLRTVRKEPERNRFTGRLGSRGAVL